MSATLAANPSPATQSRHAGPLPAFAAGPLAAGQQFAGRYSVIRMLGSGGMGAVYQAWDQELGVVVAVKVIRPDVVRDASGADALERRFKRELLLARAVTHKNVVRIHDLGEVDGIKYITMPYIHGSDLAGELRRNGKLPVRRGLRLAREIAAGLSAAHQAGVIHRDLKPANVMLDEDDHAQIMDFGIARSAGDTDGATVGVVTGTIGYMAPEQARGAAVDQRSDIYSFGLILYEIFGGPRPATESSGALADLMARMQQAPPPLRTIDPGLPRALDRIATRCLEPDPDRRYQNMEDLIADLGALTEDGEAPAGSAVAQRTKSPAARIRVRPAALRRGMIAGALVVAALAAFLGRGFLMRALGPGSEGSGTGTSLAVLPFRNASGDASLSWLGTSMPDTLRTEVGQSSELRTVPPDRVYQILKDLRTDADAVFDSSSLARIAEFSSADLILWGQYLRYGDEIRLDATLLDVKRQRSIPLKATAASERELPAAFGELARGVRENLALSRRGAGELEASAAWRPSTASMQALRHYSEGVQFARQGRALDARRSFEAAVQEDAGFALAHSKLAAAAASAGSTDEAMNFARKAVALAEPLPPREKLLIRAAQARLLNNHDEAIAAYEQLSAALAESDDVRFALGGLYEATGAYAKARDEYAALVRRDPKYIEGLLALGRVETKLGGAQRGLEHLNRALQLAIDLDNVQAKSEILRSLGQTYRTLGRAEDALRQFEQSLAIERQIGRQSGVADALAGIAASEAALGRLDRALAGYSESLAIRRELGDPGGIAAALHGLGQLHEQRGQYEQAFAHYKDALQRYRETGAKNSEALMLNNIGNLHLSRGELEEARTYFERALTLYEAMKAPVDTARTLHNLAVVAANGGDYERATRHYVRALELRREGGDRRGTAIESYSLGVLFEYQAQFGKALDAHADAVRILREIREGGFWLAAILGQQGSALNQTGRFDEARPVLDEALAIAKPLRHPLLIAQITTFQGDGYYFQGDASRARTFYEAAREALGPSPDRRIGLQVKVALARPGVIGAPPKAAAEISRRLVGEADATGYKHLAVESSVNLGEMLARAGSAAAARQELERALSRSERFGLRVLAARSHHLLAALADRSRDPAGARRHREQARLLVEEIRKDARTDAVLKRADLANLQ